MKTYYYPIGCNVLDTKGKPECGACDQRMRLGDDAFDDAIEAIENEGIAATDRKIRARKLSEAVLRRFTGSEHRHRHGLNRNVLYTDGVKYVAEAGGANWLLDSIGLAQLCDRRVAAEEFQVWKLAARPDRSATLTCEHGNYNVVFTHRLSFTDFPAPEMTLWSVPAAAPRFSWKYPRG